MQEELQKIALELKEWCDKYNKSYATVCFCDNAILANLDNDDEDYKTCRVFKDFKKERRI